MCNLNDKMHEVILLVLSHGLCLNYIQNIKPDNLLLTSSLTHLLSSCLLDVIHIYIHLVTLWNTVLSLINNYEQMSNAILTP